jgi:uncharacterized protein with GYD domain
VTIIEADNNERVMGIAIELGARGTLTTLSMPAVDTDKFISRAWSTR